MNVREWALPVYTILMQLAIGAFFFLWVIRTLNSAKYGHEKMDQITTMPVLIIFSTIILAMVGAHFHLSKPYLSFLAVRNFRYSWLSREVTFTVMLFLLTGGLLGLLKFSKGYHLLKLGLGWGAILVGFATVFCMANIYLLSTQIIWNSPATIISYYATMLLLGATSLIVIMLMDLGLSEAKSSEDFNVHTQVIGKSIVWLTSTSAMAALLVIALGIYQIEILRGMDLASAQASLKLIVGLYKPLFVMQIGVTVLGVAWLAAVVSYFIKTQRSFMKLLGPAFIACIMVLIGGILERFLFYATHVRVGL